MSATGNVNELGIRPYEVDLPSEPGTEIHVVRYVKPKLGSDKTKGVVPIARSDILFSMVQVVRIGGENNLHSHPIMDGLWFVLAGHARFYGEGDKLIAEVGPHEGVFIPRGAKYWFESSGKDELEILQVSAFDRSNKDTLRIDHVPKKLDPGKIQIFKSGGTAEL